MIDLLPPQNLEAEACVLGACLMNPDAFEKVQSIIQEPHIFYKNAYAEIYAAALSLLAKKNPIDALSISEELKAQGKYEEIGGKETILALLSNVPVVANAEYYAEVVKKNYLLRQLQRFGYALMSSVSAPDSEPLVIAEKYCRDLLDLISGASQSNEIFHIREKLSDFYNRLSENLPGGIFNEQYIKTGNTKFDTLTGGLCRGYLKIVAARPGMGKSTFVVNQILGIAKTGGLCYFVSSEISEMMTILRILARQADVNSSVIARGEECGRKITDAELQRIARACSELGEMNLLISTDRKSIDQIKRDIDWITLNYRKPDCVFIDRIEFMRELQGEVKDRTHVLGHISCELAQMAKALNISIEVIQQLSRELERRPNKRPQISDLRDSGMVEENAKMVILIYRDEYYNVNSEKKGIAEIIIAKNSDGELGTIEMTFRKDIPGFYEYEARYAEPRDESREEWFQQ